MSGCYNRPSYRDKDNIVIRIASRSDTRYYNSVAYPTFTGSSAFGGVYYDENNKAVFNAFKPSLSIDCDSMFYGMMNDKTHKNYYFSLTYDYYKITENYKDADVRIDFFGFKAYNKNFDSIKLIGNQLWLYCE